MAKLSSGLTITPVRMGVKDPLSCVVSTLALVKMSTNSV